MTMNERDINDALATVVPDELGLDLVSAGAVRELRVMPDRVLLDITLGFPCRGAIERYRQQVHDALQPLLDGRPLQLHLDWKVTPHRAQQGRPSHPDVRNVIAIASGKGGVGKSTTAVNLALALKEEGARVGILDADIFGPSVPTMLGVAPGTRPRVKDNRLFIPVEALGLHSMSIGYVVDEQAPVVWRGPKASGALQQLFEQTLWPELDYLLIDMPPGTGDIQLTLAQRIPVAGAVIVTTPQDIALLDAIRGIEMFRKVDIGVLGIVENMAVHVCAACGHREHVFGSGGGERIAARYQTGMLGSLPLSLGIRESADGGRPSVAADPDGEVARLYRDVARRMAARLSRQAPGNVAFPRVHTES